MLFDQVINKSQQCQSPAHNIFIRNLIESDQNGDRNCQEIYEQQYGQV